MSDNKFPCHPFRATLYQHNGAPKFNEFYITVPVPFGCSTRGDFANGMGRYYKFEFWTEIHHKDPSVDDNIVGARAANAEEHTNGIEKASV